MTLFLRALPIKEISLLSCLLLGACGGGSDGGDDDDDNGGALAACGATFIGNGSATTITVSGRITYADVPTSAFFNGLQYSLEQALPVRGATVEACNSNGIFASTTTTTDGEYNFNVPAGTTLRVRVRAQLVQTGSPSWDVRVVDNTNNKSLYVLTGGLADTGDASQRRDLHAPSGWTGAAYTQTRSAGPFAILDTIYQSMQTVIGADSTANFPALLVNWSVNNQPAAGNENNGEISTSFYRSSTTEIFVLGEENSDTDEYDDHVVAHEWGHYFQDVFSRDDSIGGPHSLNDRLDIRIAFSEGWGNALAAITTGRPVYRDTEAAGQALGFGFSVENNNVVSTRRGWFSEDSAQSIIYDIFDSNDDGADTVSLGFEALYEALTSTEFTGFDSPLSIYLLADRVRANNPGSNITGLLAGQNIFGTDAFGTNETTLAAELPVINTINNGQTINVCSHDDNGVFNKLGNRRFFRVTLNAQGSYRFSAVRTSGLANADPDITLYRDGSLLRSARSQVSNSETFVITLNPGSYWFEVFQYTNITGQQAGDVCFDVSVSDS